MNTTLDVGSKQTVTDQAAPKEQPDQGLFCFHMLFLSDNLVVALRANKL